MTFNVSKIRYKNTRTMDPPVMFVEFSLCGKCSICGRFTFDDIACTNCISNAKYNENLAKKIKLHRKLKKL